ncbi:MAG: DEAD/DEAH box helicase [Ilumatobacteraceae bacterium]
MPARPPAGLVDPALQFVWVDGQVLAWNPEVPFRAGAGLGRPAGHRVVSLLLPDDGSGEVVNVACREVATTALGALAELGELDEGVQPTVAWFAAVHEYAQRLVRAGRVIPRLVADTDLPPVRDGATWWRAEWHALRSDVQRGRDTVLLARPPAAVAAVGHTAAPADVLGTMVDRLARTTLAAGGWHTVLPDIRSNAARALRLVGRALVAEQSLFSVPPELGEAVATMAAEFADITRRANGEPVVRLRLRLSTPPSNRDASAVGVTPDEVPHADLVGAESWPLDAEVVDVDDRSRWCSLVALRRHDEGAIELARGEYHIGALLEGVEAAMRAVHDEVPELDDWLRGLSTSDSGPSCTDVRGAAALLDALERLTARGVELLVPERLVRRTPSARGTVRPADADADSSSLAPRFGARALVDWQVVVDDTPVSEEALQRAAADGASLIEVGGRWVQVDRADAQRALARLDEHRAMHGELSPLELLELAADLAARLTGGAVPRRRERAGLRMVDEVTDTTSDSVDDALVGEGWAADLLAGMPDVTARDGVVPPAFTATLRPYQLRGLGWLQALRELSLGGCLADDMGLGKTPTTLAHLAGVPGPHLVVCPLSVVRNWESEAARFAPTLRVLVHHGSSRASSTRLADRVAQHDLVVTTYQVATRDIATLRDIPWSTLVLDEAQMVKNPDAATTKALRTVRADQALALTGTPVENRLRELWSIFNIVVPGLLGNATKFRDRFATPIERQRDAAATAALRSLVGPFLLRRTKADRSLVPDLPDKVEQIAWAALTREQAAMYQAVVDQLLRDAQSAKGMQRRGLVLAALTRLKQICNHPAHALADGSRLSGRSGKLHRFDELVTDFVDAGERALVFTQFTEMGTLLQSHLLEKFHLRVPFLHGGVSKSMRDRMVDAFQSDEHAPPLLLVSLRAGGTGLNLTAASRVVHYDRWWNPAVEDQATDRAWRIGQQRSVFVHKLVCEGTVEERIDALINDKKALAEAVVGASGEQWLSELSTDDLRALVVLDHSKVRH